MSVASSKSFGVMFVLMVIAVLAFLPRQAVKMSIPDTSSVETSGWEELLDAEMASGISPEFEKLAANIDVGHVFEGEPEKVHSRLRTLEAIGSSPLPPNGGCFYRKSSEFHSEAVVLRWVFKEMFKGNSHSYNGGMFLQNISNPERSTIIPNSNGKNSVPPDFEEISPQDPRCVKALEFFKAWAEIVRQILESGPWPGMPLLP